MEREVLSMILGGGRGSRLLPLTLLRSKPAVPIAGKYRLIDIPISNCINSNFNRIYVLTQFLSISLHRHISNTYKFDVFGKGFVEILAAQQTNETSDWYQGTADAVRQNIRIILEDPCRDVLILSGDQLYRMDYRDLLETHRDTKADITIAVLPVAEKDVAGFGIVRLDEQGRIVGFVEKPKSREQLPPLRTDDHWIESRGVPCQGRNYMASMGIYLFRRKVLLDLLSGEHPSTDFGKEVFPRSIASYNVQAHLFDGYWEDVGTVKSYHEANLALCSAQPPFEFNQSGAPIYTRMRYLPAARIHGTLDDVLVSDGCVIQEGTHIRRSVIGVRTQIGRDVRISNSVIIGADAFENAETKAANQARGLPNFGIGDGCVIDNAILDKDCRIGRNVRITNDKKVQNYQCDDYVITDGIVVVPKGRVLADNTVI
jgi:glucose-1-phosphate adenylyltransferase